MTSRPLRLVPDVGTDHFELRVADGTRLDVEADGPVDAAVTVVFVHGFTLDLTSFRHQRATLDAAGGNVRRIYFDQRGFGSSARGPRGVASIDQLALDLAELVEAAPGAVVLVGHSMGAMVIQALAGLRPDLIGGRVRGTVLIASARSGREIDLHGLELLARLVGPRALRALHRARPLVRLAGRAPFDLVAWAMHDRRSLAVHRRAFAEMVQANPLDVVADYLAAMFAHDARGSVAELGRTETVVVAGRSDLVTPVAANRRLARSIPGSRLVLVERAGHMVTFEGAPAVDEAIADVVAKVIAAG
ncbi:alpha/beta fold hydrolase [Nocardioides jiangxiensis]|uniref:Alpha/beta hydrolase n=1 Tax=Nocardioides jiangxiensis TaxID=3064524 RepID=A0ABT9B1Q0_9ACTN|nr:alpha/beta hydrolase [Nocardioides sp. WY-20]MDO7868782.1 alpha/beta hydrolase [Nocardioides sp. WY-20]